ncbi:MAG: signal peptide peptidase SppA [Rubrivivax sp.]
MPRSVPRRLFDALAWVWRVLDATRRGIANLLLLALLAAFAFWWWHRGPPPLQERTTLVVAPGGPLREQFAGNLREDALSQLRGNPVAVTRLRDLLAVLDGAAADPKIERVLLLLDDFGGAGLPAMREAARALERVKAAGKPVIAWASGYDQRQYFLAAHASEVWLHPMGSVLVTGYAAQRSYLKDALDKLGVQAHVLRAGQYKNAGETFTASAPSPQTQEADRALYDGLWASYAGAVEKARKLPAGALSKSLDALPESLVAAGGDTAKLALQEKWVDALKTRDEMRQALVEAGVKDGKTFRQISAGAFLARVQAPRGADALAVVVAEGPIVDGKAPSGVIGGLSTAELIRAAREDEKVKALVLRVDSPGGSAFGAELVRRELELTRKAGKPVVVSMGDVAASGGYWISMAADEVIADEATITGSIGVVALLPSAEKGLATLGVHTEGYATHWLAQGYDPRSGMDPRFARVVQSAIDHIYADFTGKAAAARKTEVAKIDAVAQGRVWTGAQAKERGLVDRLGGFGDALAAAAKRGGLAEGHRVVYLEREPGRLERLIAYLGAEVGAALPAPAWPPALPAPLAGLREQAAWLADSARNGQAFSALAHCLCSAP